MWAKHKPNLETAVHHIINGSNDCGQARDADMVEDGVRDWPGLTSNEADFLDEWSLLNDNSSTTYRDTLMVDVSDGVSDASFATMFSSFSMVQEEEP